MPAGTNNIKIDADTLSIETTTVNTLTRQQIEVLLNEIAVQKALAIVTYDNQTSQYNAMLAVLNQT